MTTNLYELYEDLLKMNKGWNPGPLGVEYLKDVLEESEDEGIHEAVSGAIAILSNKDMAKELLMSLGWDEDLADDMLQDVSFSKSADIVYRQIQWLIDRDICPVCGGSIVADGFTDYGNGHNDLGCGWTTTKVYCEDCGETFED